MPELYGGSHPECATCIDIRLIVERHHDLDGMVLRDPIARMGGYARAAHERYTGHVVIADAPDEWVAALGIPGTVCGACGMPTESEPCAAHQPQAYGLIGSIAESGDSR